MRRLHVAAALHILIFRELPAHTESRLIGIYFNLINNFRRSQRMVNSFPQELTQIKECHERERKEEEEKKNKTCSHQCIFYPEVSLFWIHNNPSSALANPDVDSFKIIAQHNTTVILINLPLLILRMLI